jgi:indolepyruvate ferredoxin oxidoreductase beta subunit
MAHLPGDYALACEVLRCRRLIKGYSDTHARGLSKFDRVMAGIVLVEGRPDAADWARRLREAALKDEEGRALDGALQTIRSFADSGAAAD